MNSIMVPNPGVGEPPLVYEEYSDDEGTGNNQDGEEMQNYRGFDKEEMYKQKMSSFIRLLEDILNPAEIPEARELDAVF